MMFFLFSWYRAPRDLHVLTHSFPSRRSSDLGDDGRLNFKKGETFSKIFKGLHDLELKYGDTGVFVRGKYWYDFELKDESRPFKDISDSNRKEGRSEEHTSELQSLMRISYAVFCLTKKTHEINKVPSTN